MTQTMKGKNSQDLKTPRPGQRQQERLQRLARRKRRRQIALTTVAALLLLVAGTAGFLQYQKYTADQATAAQKLKDQQATATSVVHSTATAVAIAPTATAIALTPTPAAGPATPPPVSIAPTTLKDGLQYIDIREGYGDPVQSGQTVSVEYTGWVQSTGKKFDSSYDRGAQAFPVTLGANKTIPGFEEGIAGMKVGGIRRIIIPPALGYGAQGNGAVIPPNATLIFDVTIVPAPPGTPTPQPGQ